MRKLIGLLLCLLASVFALTGCIASLQLSQRALVQAIGVDYDGKTYQLTLQIFNPSSGSKETKSSPGKESTTILKAQGKTISEAFEEANAMQGKKIFLGNNKIIIIGRPIAQQWLEFSVNFFDTHQEARPTTTILVAEASAESIITAKGENGPLQAIDIEKTVQQQIKNGRIAQSQIIDVISQIQSEGQDVAIPIIALGKDDAGNPVIDLSQTGLFVENRLVATLNQAQTLGMQWANGEIRHVLTTIAIAQEEAVSLLTDQTRAKITCSVENNIPHFFIKIQADISVEEFVGARSNSIQPQEIQALHQNAVANQVQAAIEKAVRGEGCDVFYFGERLQKYQYKYWQQNKNNWQQIIKSSVIEVEVSSTVIKSIATDNQQKR